ncbi:spore germination protein [Cytobacillus kochii]
MSNNRQIHLTDDLLGNLEIIKSHINNPSDLIIRNLIIGKSSKINAGLLYIDNIVNIQDIQEHIINPLLTLDTLKGSIDEVAYHHIKSSEVTINTSFNSLIEGLLKGKTVILFDNCSKGILSSTEDWQVRTLEEAIQERVIRGPVIGFTEKMNINLNLLRGILQTPDLCVVSRQVGEYTKTDVSILYIKGIAKQEIIDDVLSKVSKINVKYLIESRMVEESLEKGVKTFFPLVINTERPDSTVSGLLEGKIAILVNGTPSAILVPALFNQFLQVSDEYYGKFGRLTGRFLRFLCFLISVYLPGIYISLVNSNEGIISEQNVQKLLGKDDILLPIFWQVLLLLIVLQFIMDGSFRLPRSTVLVVSLIGSIFVGEAAVNAKLIHSSSIIFMGLTYLTSFLVLSKGFESAVFALRMIFLLIGQFFGFMGMITGITILIIYATSLRSMGVPYLAPFIPFNPIEMKDFLYRGNTKDLINSKHTYPYDYNKNDKT